VPRALVRGVWGISPEKKIGFTASLDAILLKLERAFSFGLRITLIYQQFPETVAIFHTPEPSV